MAGLGGSLGYALGAINWDATALGKLKTKEYPHVCVFAQDVALKSI
jgi:hypothetical protein